MKRVCAILGVALAALIITGCGSGSSQIEQYAGQELTPAGTHSGNRSILGEWRFVYMNKPLLMFGKDFSPPPSFDSIDFRTNGTIRLIDSMSHNDFIGTYTLDGNKIKWKFTPPNVTNSIEHKLVYSWAERGSALVLRLTDDKQGIPPEVEWTYYRPERLLPVDAIVGNWTTTSKGKSADMTFEKDGRFYMNGKKYWGYYRLWLSNHGNTLTTPIWIQGEGGFIIHYLYKIDSDTLTLTPLGQDGPHKEDITVWNRTSQ